MNIKSFLSDVLGFGIASFLTKGAALLIVPILTRNLSPAEYGSLEILVGFGAIAAVLVSLSLESYIARQWGGMQQKTEQSKLFSSTCLVVLILGIVAVTVSFLSARFASNTLFGNASYSMPIVLIVSYGTLMALLSLPLIVLRMERLLKPYLAVVLIQSTAYLISVLWLLNESSITVETIVLAMLISGLLSLFVALFSVRKYLVVSFDRALLKVSLRYSLPLLPAVGATWINSQVDKYTLLYFLDAKVVGEFAVVTKIAAVVAMGVMVFRQAWLPYSFKLAKMPGNGAVQFRQVMNWYYFIGLSLCLLVVLFSKPIISLLVPDDYQIDVSVLPVLLSASLVYGSASIANIGMLVSGKTEWNSYASLVGVFLNIVLTFILVPIYGVAGAAYGTLVAAGVFTLVLAVRTKIELDITFGMLPAGVMFCYFVLSYAAVM